MSNYRPVVILVFAVVVYTLAWSAGGKDISPAAASEPQPKIKLEGKEKVAAPMVYFAAMEDYKNFPKLKHVIDSTIGMAAQFDKIGYQVRFLTDGGSVEKAKTGIKQKNSVHECNNADDLINDIKSWLDAVAKARPPLAILVVAGHGEERVVVTKKDSPGRKVAFFLTRDDATGRGGVSIDEISEAAAQRTGVPIVIIYDACRTLANRAITSSNATHFNAGLANAFTVTTEGNPKPRLSATGNLPEGVTFVDNGDGTATLAGTPPDSACGTFPFTITSKEGDNSVDQIFTLTVRDKPLSASVGTPQVTTNASLSSSGYPYPTILYSTQSGKIANDSDCLIFNLTAGLKYDSNVKQFLGWHSPDMIAGKAMEMTLYHWFYYGLNGLLRSQNLEQAHEIVVSKGTPLSTSVYTMIKGEPKAPVNTLAELELLAEFHHATGKLKSEFDPRVGLTITRQIGVTDELFSSSAFGLPNGYEVTEKSLVMDVVATADKALQAQSGNLMTIEASPSNYDPKTQSHEYLGAGSVGRIMYNHLTRLKFPLTSRINPNSKLPYTMTGIAVIAQKKPLNAGPAIADPWPEGAEVRLVELKLISQSAQSLETPKIGSDQIKQEILQAWLIDRKDSLLVPKPWDTKSRSVGLASKDAQMGRIGGSLSSRKYATPSSYLELELENGGAAAQLTVELIYNDPISGRDYSLIDRKELKLPHGQPAKPLQIPITRSGYANYFALSTNATDLRITRVSIKPSLK